MLSPFWAIDRAEFDLTLKKTIIFIRPVPQTELKNPTSSANLTPATAQFFRN